MGIFSTITGFNPYVAIAGVVAVAALAGTIGYQNHEIHKYHTEYSCVNNGDCAVNYKGDTLPSLRLTIKDMQGHQAEQTQKTGDTITKVVTVTIPPVVKIIHDAPIPKDCSTPALDTLRNNT